MCPTMRAERGAMRDAETGVAGWPRVAVVGPGGVGAYFGGMLARAGAEVTMLGRPGAASPHLDALAREGLRLRARTFDERVAVQVATEPQAVHGADLVLFCVKTTDTERAAKQIAPHLAAGTIVVDLQNGVDNPERMRRQGVDPLAAAVYVAASIEGPGEVRHRGRGDLVLGSATRAAEVERVRGWFERAGVACRVVPDVERELWTKLIVNSMANAVSALTGATYGRMVDFEPTWAIAMDVAREGVAVAERAGHSFSAEAVIGECRAICRAIADATSSTEQDLVRGRPTEIDALNGYIAWRGAELGVPTPINRTLWALVKLRESR